MSELEGLVGIITEIESFGLSLVNGIVELCPFSIILDEQENKKIEKKFFCNVFSIKRNCILLLR